MKIIVKDLAELDKLAAALAAFLKPEPDAATVLGLYGELGSGKTAFTQALGRALGIKEPITSPTFVLQKSYQLGATSLFKKFIHVDCFRINSPEELLPLGWPELITNPTNLITIEWADRVVTILPPTHLKLCFSHLTESTREVVLELTAAPIQNFRP